MRRKIALYIADRLVDLDDQSFILMNYTMEDLSNPTIVKNSFSQQVTLKGTPNNNKIFGDIFRLDRVTQYGEGYTGVEFDVTRQTPFAIYNEMSEIIESGYLKLNEVSRNKGMVEYKVTLFGGLGSFFYSLMYNEDGSKKTLADMRYRDLSGGYTKIPGHFGQIGGYEMLKDAWNYLADPNAYDYESNDNWWCNIINFAPCYNGKPDSFSADKAMVDNKSFANVPYTKLIEGTQYTFKENASANLMLFANPHTEWEMRDLRWYLQRPVISVKALFDAICDKENNGGWNVSLNIGMTNPYSFRDAWITLPMIPSEDRHEADAIVKLLAASKSPAEYIISYAKIFGHVFLCDAKTKSITIMPRFMFYINQETIDLTGKVDEKGIKITPLLAQSRFYQFGSNAIGEWAKTYKEDFGEDYAIQRINTGNEFNYDTTMVTDGIIYKDAVEVQERNLLFTSNSLNKAKEESFILPRYESVKVQLWGKKSGDTEQSAQEIEVTLPYEETRYFFDPDYPLSDWLPKAQFHEKDNKAIDGSDVLLIFTGVKETPQWTSWARLEYRLTDDTSDMDLLNEGVPCWNFSQYNAKKLTSLPCFRRTRTTIIGEGDEYIADSFEWGQPQARGVNKISYSPKNITTIYERWWKNYLTDRYNTDTFTMKCKVNLKGMQVGQELMRKLFFYQGAIFVMNKIVNHSLSTWDDTECEFIKVQDINNYRR